jgi:hypothetical protein
MDYSRFTEYSRHNQSEFAQRTLPERTPDGSTINDTLQLNSLPQSTVSLTEKTSRPQSVTTSTPIAPDPSLAQLISLITEVDVRHQVPIYNGNTEASRNAIPIANTAQQLDFVNFKGTGGYINFIAADADTNGDGVVTSTEQLLYDSMHLLVSSTA